MKIAALFIAACTCAAPAVASSASAQDAAQETPFLPLPEMAPPYLFDPHPLAGTMLRPLIEPAGRTGPEVEPEAGPPPIVVAQQQAATPPAAEPAPAAEPPPAAEPAPAAEPPPAAEQPPAAEEAPAAEPEPAPKPTAAAITVIVENVESAQGTVNVALCDTGLSREGCPYSTEVQAAPGFVEAQFKDIPPGTYAVVAYHDVNNNSEFDKLFGMPREPYALSSEAAKKLVPTFADAALPMKAGANSVVIRLKRLGG
jgi:uncharacterized protein (DUF2141 family)